MKLPPYKWNTKRARMIHSREYGMVETSELVELQNADHSSMGKELSGLIE